MRSCSVIKLKTAINSVGLVKTSSLLNVSYQVIQRWLHKGMLPRTEFTGETNYSELIEKATGGSVTAKELLEESLQAYKKKAKK